MRLSDFRFELISFIIGFVAATLFWWFISRLRPLLPIYWQKLKRYIETLNEQNQAGVEEFLRRETLRRSQRAHFAASLFSLDEILVEPRLIAPPPIIEPGEQPLAVSITGQTLPYLPDWPELTTPLGAPTITPLQAIQQGSHIAIIGQPGSGKSVALAHLANQLAHNTPENGEYQNCLPMLLHVMDLEITEQSIQEPVQALIKAVSTQVGLVVQAQLSKSLQTTFRNPERKLVLLLDGLDELSPHELNTVSLFLRSLLPKLPQLVVVAAASSEYLDGLTRLGFYPLGLASWTSQQRQDFTKRWGSLWNHHLIPEIAKHFPVEPVDPLLINHWLLAETSHESLLEFTMKTWAAYAGDLNGSGLAQLIETYLARYMPAKNVLPALDELGYRFLQQGKSWMDINDMEQILSAYQPPEETLPQAPGTETAAPEAPKGKKQKRESTEVKIVSQGERIISALTHAGILVQHTGGRLRFASPIFLGYLASLKLTAEDAEKVMTRIDWTTAAQTLRFTAACTPSAPWITKLAQEAQPPLYKPLLIAARWIADAPAGTEWRTNLLRSFVGIMQNDTLPLGLRARFAAAFVTARDASTPRLFKQLLSSPSTVIRQLAIFGSGALESTQALDDLLNHLADPDPLIQNTACLAISALPGDAALATLADILTQGDENMRQAAAERLAMSPEGQQIMAETVKHEDLLTRRASVFGLLHTRADWARQILEKVVVEDGQWVVRNAAGQALEELKQPDIFVPKPLPAPSECGWLLAFASRLGQGIRPDQPATEILITALKSGSVEEQIASLNYLRNEPDEGIAGMIYNTLYSDEDRIKEPSLLALWWMALGGAKLPSPEQFGLG